ncbi:MAG: Hsp20/alpha crystallin family protein [Acholeplasmatales bacterium]|nr:Hsp20/alpha crystallin family protein [Acholeplasmatales bacterium]
MYNLENKKDNYFGLFDEFNNLFSDALGKDMKTNILEEDDKYVVTSEVPGIDKKNIKIDVSDNTLVININKKSDKKEAKTNYLVKEISESNVSRSFYLDDMDENNVTAKMDNGILTITVLKNKEIKSGIKKIMIE